MFQLLQGALLIPGHGALNAVVFLAILALPADLIVGSELIQGFGSFGNKFILL